MAELPESAAKQQTPRVWAPFFRQKGPGCKPAGWASCRPRQNPQPGKAGRSRGRCGGPRASALGPRRGSGTTKAETRLPGKSRGRAGRRWRRGAWGLAVLTRPAPPARSSSALPVTPASLGVCGFAWSSPSPPPPPNRRALTGVIDVQVVADGVPGSGQSFSAKQHGKGPHHGAGVVPQAPRPLPGPLPSAHEPGKACRQMGGGGRLLLAGERRGGRRGWPHRPAPSRPSGKPVSGRYLQPPVTPVPGYFWVCRAAAPKQHELVARAGPPSLEQGGAVA